MLLAAGSPGSPQVRALLRAPRCGLGFNLNSLFVLPPAPLPAQVRFLPEPPSVRTALPRAVSCAPLAFHVFFPASGAGAQGPAECPAGFCPARLCPALLSRSLRRDPLDSGIKNCSGRLAEARANPSLRGGAEARRTSQVRSGVSRVRASGQGSAAAAFPVEVGLDWSAGPPVSPPWNPSASCASASPKAPGPAAPRPLLLERDKEGFGAAASPKAQLYKFSPCFGTEGNPPCQPHHPGRLWQVLEDPSAPCSKNRTVS